MTFIFEQVRFSFIMSLSVFSTVHVGKKLLQAPEMNESLQSLVSNNLDTCLSPSYAITQSFSFGAEYNWYPFASIHACQYRRFLKNEVVLELQHSQLSLLQDKEANNDCFIMFGSIFSKLHLVKLIADMSQPVAHSVIDRCICLFIINVPCNGMASVIRKLITF